MSKYHALSFVYVFDSVMKTWRQVIDKMPSCPPFFLKLPRYSTPDTFSLKPGGLSRIRRELIIALVLNFYPIISHSS